VTGGHRRRRAEALTGLVRMALRPLGRECGVRAPMTRLPSRPDKRLRLGSPLTAPRARPVARRLVYFTFACLFVAVAWIGITLAANPRRYKAELDPPGVVESLPKFQSGPLTGWYVYVYMRKERVVCANPQVWDGPKVITCSHVVAIDEMAKPGQAVPAGGPHAEAVRPGGQVQKGEESQR
jgi:hypothetical protein